MIVVKTRVRSRGLPLVHRQVLDAYVSESRRRWGFVVFGCAGIVITNVLILSAIDGGGEEAGNFYAGIIGISVLAIVSLFMTTKRLKRMRLKVRFLGELLMRLRPELHPTGKSSLRFDLRFYDTKRPFWTGRSSHGNRKAKYSDKWLHLKVLLADGSILRIVRQAGIKTKKGAIVREKRRLFLTLMPGSRYRLVTTDGPVVDANLLKGRLKHVVATSFHDPPEEFHVVPQLTECKWHVRVTQLDADILVDEVIALITQMMTLLNRAPLRPLGHRGS